ncbi:FAD dependent oxidoreductase [Neohortaea acidophila]|uniref:FAD dependent oxidoreductase n=1 Tax=Neohortaea acidophila TaxID=245834 RepID=A0A6A6PHT9_9PEZI|nr:FAD dependent oxidoreductase [Neohortaea acidophila]KAF2479356.1 FAD dependent oxidoreductase [Neohortaea acidophila]
MSVPDDSILILGAGIFGTSTAYHLAKTYRNPDRITVIDRTASPPDLAASTDINKIIRADYSSRFYCDLAYEALDAWKTWPELQPYYHQSGWIMLDGEDSDLAERIRRVFRDRGHDLTSDMELGELDERWGGCLNGTDTTGLKNGYWNPEAGWCEAAAATGSLMEAAKRLGVRYVTADVVGVELDGARVSGLRTAKGELLTADKIVIATGAWTSSLLSPLENELNIPEDERVEKQAQAAGVAVAHYKMTDQEMSQLRDMPVVVYGESGEVIPPPLSNRLLKFTNARTFTNIETTKSGHKISVPPNRDQHIVSDRLKRETETHMMSKVMPAFAKGKTADYWRICWDARTPTQDWLLCRHPDDRLSNLYFSVGGSFHSYKFLPNAGKYMVNVLNGTGNGEERDRAWGWKKAGAGWRGAHEKTAPKRDLKDLDYGE